MVHIHICVDHSKPERARIEFHIMSTIVLVFPQHFDCLAANDFDRRANEKHSRFDFFCAKSQKPDEFIALK